MANISDAAIPLSPTRIAYAEADFPSVLSSLLGDAAPAQISTVGNTALLQLPLLGFFCSRKAPGNIILRAYDWARATRDAGIPVIGGFQSAMEQECLDFLLRGTQPVVVCPARGIGAMRLSPPWREAIEQGRLLLLSPFTDRERRATAALAAKRNRFVAALAERILIAHASPGGALMALAEEALEWGKPVCAFDDPANAELLERGAHTHDMKRHDQ